jgi:hypothetical protein
MNLIYSLCSLATRGRDDLDHRIHVLLKSTATTRHSDENQQQLRHDRQDIGALAQLNYPKAWE